MLIKRCAQCFQPFLWSRMFSNNFDCP